MPRRHQEHVERGDQLTYEQVLDEVRQLDERDRNRKVSPLRIAAGPIVLDTTDMSPEAVVEDILGYLPKRKTTP